MESIDPACNEFKHRYDQCFNQWYLDHFLKESTQDPCQELFSVYNACVKVK
ncbi:hypothetical protein HMI54_012129 [Coelomomyces lativittatus]|nr:hypothetical protein HMI54_012129 [Coelomomyces lativittatus]